MSAGYDIGASASTSSGAQGGFTGDINLTTGGKGLLPTLPGSQAWLAWLAVAAVVVIGLVFWMKKK